MLKSLRNTLIMTAMYVPCDMALSLLLATLLARVTRFGGFFRTIFYLPVMTPTVAIGSHVPADLQRQLRPARPRALS